MIEILNHWLAENFPNHSDAGWMILSLFVCIAAIITDLIARMIMSQLLKQVKKTEMLWDDVVIESISKPLLLLVWLIAGYWLLQIFEQNFDIEIFVNNSKLPRTALMILVAWFCLRFIKNIEAVLILPERMKKPMDATTVGALGRLLRLVIVVIITLTIMQSYGYSVSGILAFGGIGGIAIGFAAKDLLANFFGGLMIYLDRPFKVGDWIRSPDKNIEGTVEEIGWRQTRIRTFDKRPLYVPNQTFTNIAVENPSRMTHRRIYEYVGVRYNDAKQVENIIANVKQMLRSNPEIDTNQTLIVNLNRFGPSSLDFFIYTFTKTTNWVRYHDIKQDVMMKVVGIIEAQGAEFAFPTTTVHLMQEAPEPEPNIEE